MSQALEVGGTTAGLVDELASLGATLPWMALLTGISTFVLLFLAFGSVVLPLKAIVMLAIIFGLSTVAVASGLQRTGGLITSLAALLLIIVVGAFSASSITFIKLMGVGAAAAAPAVRQVRDQR